MITFQSINTADTADYQWVEELLTTSFPVQEYRPLNIFRQYTDQPNNFHNNLIWDDEQRIGFITYWDFGSFYYIEHFATAPSVRNAGYGKRILEALCEKITLPLVLEVEHPTEELAQRRIQFYQRQGFKLWENDYFQPPYRKGEPIFPMYIMVRGELNQEKDYEFIKDTIHKTVYKLEA